MDDDLYMSEIRKVSKKNNSFSYFTKFVNYISKMYLSYNQKLICSSSHEVYKNINSKTSCHCIYNCFYGMYVTEQVIIESYFYMTHHHYRQ